MATDDDILRRVLDSIPPAAAGAPPSDYAMRPLIDALAERLRLAQERLDLALEVASLGLWEWDVASDMLTSWRTRSNATGAPMRQATLSAQLELVHPEDRDRLRQRLEHAAEGGDDLESLAFRMLAPDGGVRHMLGSARVMRLAGERATCILAALIDVTERRALEENLQHAQKVECLGQVAGGVAHDFRNLLTVMLAGSQMLLEEMPQGHPWREIVEDIHAASERGEALTQQLLTFSRKASSQPAVVDVCDLIVKLEPLLRRVTQGDIALRLRLDSSAGQVFADPTQIEQVVMNLIFNARDAMPSGGTVTVGARAAELSAELTETSDARGTQFAVIEVQDTGGGIDPTVQARIFEPFFSTKEAGKGTGLGLAMVANAARQWGGLVQVESTPGQGATFRVLLPRLSQ